MALELISVKKVVLKNNLKYHGITLLTYRIEYPEFRSVSSRRCLSKVNQFYKEKALEFHRYCENDLFDMAVAQYKEDIKNNFPVRVFEAMQVYKVTYLSACILSVYFDRYQYTGGAHGGTIRTSQTWQLQRCGFIPLKNLVRCPPDYKSYILKEVEAQIKKEPDLYFEDYKELIAKTFNENSFYCTSKGLVVYYQQYDIAPYSSGIREFLLPYSACVINPRKLCV